MCLSKLSLKVKKWVKTALVALGLVGVAFAATTLTQIPQEMELIHIIGERSITVFDCEGVELTEFNTDIDYNERFINLNGKRPNPPTKEGCIWKESSRAVWFDTADGNIHDNQYAEKLENGRERVFFMTGGEFKNLSKEDVISKKIIKP